ncbi:MAG: polymer-forming cytoskeletal protein [Phycisphaerales bacterium]|nr:polymer-forming cytoskeletal protein [Phycisphaerales bacterium]
MTETAPQMTIISADTQVRGELIIQNAGLILGTVEGKVLSQGRLHIGEGAVCKSSVEGASITVDGTVEGNVLARERLELNTTARIKGDITAAKLIVAEGASFSGNCSVGTEAVRNAKMDEIAPAPNGKPRMKLNGTGENGLEATLAGLEAKLAGFTKTKVGVGE